MRILALSTWFPFPPDNGSKARAYNLLSRLGEKHTLDLIALSQSGRDAEHLGEVQRFCRRVEVFPEPRFHPKDVRSWLGFFSPVPRYFRAHHCPEMEALSMQWAQEENYDAALAVTLGAAPCAAKLNVRFKVLDQHNVESQVIKRRWQNERSLRRRLRYAPTWMKAERFERAVARKFDAVMVVSEPELHMMEHLLGNGHRAKIHVIPNGVDSSFLEYRAPAREHRVLVFTGALAYQPNYDAAVRLCRRILPAVRSEFPDARLRITGRLDGVDIEGLMRIAGVEFTGYVEDIRPVVASASALVVPLRYGGGTRLKILEAMALGTPVVSTPVGAEGLQAQDGVHILIAESDAALAEQISRVLADTGLAARIAQNAHALVQKRYRWDAIAAEFECILVAHEEGTAGTCTGVK
ncbi:MAG TPA: glycosyltransferase family 4 protein [Armatimonadota bacterium]|nr:glycosyltransferase family 4 protein [Armatimonadota bacterium]